MNVAQSFSGMSEWWFLVDQNNEFKMVCAERGTFTVDLPSADLISLSTNQVDTYAVFEDGTMLKWKEPSQGNNYKPKVVGIPQVVSLEGDISDVVCGSDFVGVVTRAGEYFTWGSNGFGQLGQGHQIDQNVIQKVALPAPVVQATCGCHHVLVLLEDGRVFGWGRNDDGKVGVGICSRELTSPTQLQLENVSRLFCGSHSSAAITKKGELFVWGWNEHYNLGLGTTQDESNPTRLFPSGVVSIGMGWNHSVAVFEDNSVVTWGIVGGTRSETKEPIPVELPEEVKRVELVGASVYQSCFLDQEGRLFIFGRSTLGELHERPVQLENIKFLLPPSLRRTWLSVFRWLFLGRTDPRSGISEFPIEVIYNFVLVANHNRLKIERFFIYS
jgi:alpha-tubulin suppressor-like RCC1 family protein